MTINIDDILKIVTFILLKIIEQKGNNILLKNDFYWDISNDEIYNPYEIPKTISLGQLSDELMEINRLSDSNHDAIPYDLKRIAEILKALSIENSTAY